MTHSAAHPPGQNVPRCPHGICCGAVVVREPLHVAAQLRYRISRIPVHAHRRSTRQPLLVPTDPTAGIAQRSSQLESRYSGLPFQASPLRDRPNKAVPPRTHRPIPTGHQRSRELISSTSQHSTWRWRSAEATPTLELTMRPPRRCCRIPPPACFRRRPASAAVRWWSRSGPAGRRGLHQRCVRCRWYARRSLAVVRVLRLRSCARDGTWFSPLRRGDPCRDAR